MQLTRCASVILKIIWRRFLNAILRIDQSRQRVGLRSRRKFVRQTRVGRSHLMRPETSGFQWRGGHNMIAGRESGQLHLMLPRPRRRTAIFDASLTRDRIAPINSQNPTPDNFQNDRGPGRPSPQGGSSRFFEGLPRAVERHVGEQLALGNWVRSSVATLNSMSRAAASSLESSIVRLSACRLFDHRLGLPQSEHVINRIIVS